MRKFMLTLVLLLGLCQPSFSSIFSKNELLYYIESLSLISLGCGNSNLLQSNYSKALEHFQQATILIDKIKHQYPELEFLISFGKVIAYDNLHRNFECQNELAKLRSVLLITPSALEEKNLIIERQQGEELLFQLALLSLSSDVRETLISLIQHISPELVKTDGISVMYDYMVQNEADPASIETGKHFWKNVERIAIKIYIAVIRAKEIWDILQEVKKSIKE